MTYHIFYVYNSLINDSIKLCLFQQTLTSSIEKWYIELRRTLFHILNSLATKILTQF